MQAKVTFLAESAKAFGATESILTFFGLELRRADEFDFQPFAIAMLALCRDYQRDESGIEHLRRVTEVFDLVRPPFRGATDEQLKAGLESVACYTEWIHETFPDVRTQTPERN